MRPQRPLVSRFGPVTKTVAEVAEVAEVAD